MVTIAVRNNNVDQAMRILKKNYKGGVLKEIKSRQYFEKPSVKREIRKKAEGIKRCKRAEKKRLERFN